MVLKILGLSYFFRNLSIHQPSLEWEEMEQLVYEEYNPEEDENQPATVGVSPFLSDREVEYYWARFPNCCSHCTSQEDVVPIRSFVTAVAAWAEKWTLALCVNILS